MTIDSVDNKKIKNIRKLNQKKYRDETNEFLVEGIHLVKEAYKEGLLKEVVLEENEEIDFKVDTTYVTYNVNVLILDGLQDPGNLGTIIRSAVAFNVDTIILSKDTVDLYNPKVVRSTQGMNFHINIIRRDLEQEINTLKEKGYTVYSTDVINGKNIKNVKVNGKYAIIMGNEGNGVRENIKNLSDEKLYIKMNNDCESLNVGVATSIILYEFS